MAARKQLSLATNTKVYFRDPHSPWRRGSNENTYGLLRQYYSSKRTDLSSYSQAHLDKWLCSLISVPAKPWACKHQQINYKTVLRRPVEVTRDLHTFCSLCVSGVSANAS
jgi:IS30 family transposase